MTAKEARDLTDNANREETWMPGMLKQIDEMIEKKAKAGHNYMGINFAYLVHDCYVCLKMEAITKVLKENGYTISPTKIMPGYLAISW